MGLAYVCPPVQNFVRLSWQIASNICKYLLIIFTFKRDCTSRKPLKTISRVVFLYVDLGTPLHPTPTQRSPGRSTGPAPPDINTHGVANIKTTTQQHTSQSSASTQRHLTTQRKLPKSGGKNFPAPTPRRSGRMQKLAPECPPLSYSGRQPSPRRQPLKTLQAPPMPPPSTSLLGASASTPADPLTSLVGSGFNPKDTGGRGRPPLVPRKKTPLPASSTRGPKTSSPNTPNPISVVSPVLPSMTFGSRVSLVEEGPSSSAAAAPDSPGFAFHPVTAPGDAAVATPQLFGRSKPRVFNPTSRQTLQVCIFKKSVQGT